MLRFSAVAAAVVLLAANPAAAQDSGASYVLLARVKGEVSKPTIVAQYGPDKEQRGELRVPSGKGPFPVAVLIHGGCWLATTEDETGMSPLAEALARRGVATWNIEYRAIKDQGGGWPGTFDDVAAGVDYLQTLARTQPLDLKRVAVVGHSVGAQLAGWAAARGKLTGAPGGAPKVTPVALAMIDGPPSLEAFDGPDEQVCGQPLVRVLMGGTRQEKPTEYAMGSAAAHLPLGVRQLFVIGVLGGLMQDYIAAAKTAGDPVEVLKPADANHVNIIIPGEEPGDGVAAFLATRLFLNR